MTKSWFAPDRPPMHLDSPGDTWRRILVPLGGTEPVGHVIACVRDIPVRPETAVTLLRVIECGGDRQYDLRYQVDSRHRQVWEGLAEVRAGLRGRFGTVNAEVRFGDPATEILREIAEVNHDAVLLVGRGGRRFGHRRFGRVPRSVLLSSPIPLLFFPGADDSHADLPRSEGPETSRFRRLLVALDGTQEAAEILPSAEMLARTCGSEIHLFRAAPGGVRGKAARDLAHDYLRNLQRFFATRDIPSFVHVRPGCPAQAALAAIHELGIDVVALTTHARAGLARMMHGSVTRDLMHGTDVPVLTVCNHRHRLSLPEPAQEHRHVSVGRT